MYLAKLNTLLEELKNSPKGIDVKIADINPPCDPSILNGIKEDNGGVLPTAVEEFYSETNGLHIEWATREKIPVSGGYTTYASGSINLPPIDIMMDSTSPDGHLPALGLFSDQESWRGSNLNEQENMEIYRWRKECKKVELEFGGPGTGNISCIGLFPFSEESARIYFIGDEGEIYPTGYSFADYIDAAIKVKGICYWQAYLTSSETVRMNVSEDFDEAVEFMDLDLRALLPSKTKEPPIQILIPDN